MSLDVQVIAPTGRDAELIASLLRQNGVMTLPVSASLLLDGAADQPLGALLIAEEAFTATLSRKLKAFAESQPSWSDLPILVLTSSGAETSRTRRLRNEHLPQGSILLERPIRPASLLSSVQAALRARARQFEIRDAVARLKEERETLQAVLDNLPDGVALARPSGEVVLYNRRLLEMSPPGSGAGVWPQWPLYHPDGPPVGREERPLYRALQTGRAVPPEEFLYEREPGSRTWISVTAAPVFNDSGAVIGAVVAATDVEYKKRAELALIQSEKLAAVGRLAASISHEINNPLESVTNLLYLARESEGVPDEVRDHLNTADSELRRVSQIVSHTLRFHRQATKPRALSAEELLAPTLGLYAGRLHNSNVRLRVEHRGASDVTCHEGEIRQVLNNLVGNAVESMRGGGRLVVRTANSRFWKTGARAMRITVADTGHGMTPEIARHIFDAFYTTKGIHGTGLGLWISKGIVNKHSGLLQVRSSTRGECIGTIFSMVLPLDAFPSADL